MRVSKVLLSQKVYNEELHGNRELVYVEINDESGSQYFNSEDFARLISTRVTKVHVRIVVYKSWQYYFDHRGASSDEIKLEIREL